MVTPVNPVNIAPGSGAGPIQPQEFYTQTYVIAGPFLPSAPQKPLPATWYVPPANAFQSWTWQYNLNLIGKDRLPVGEISTALPPQPPVPTGLTWIASPAQPVTVAAVTFRGLWKSLPDQPPPPNAFQSWAWQYNLNLISQDQMTVGEQVTDLAPSQRTPEQIQLHSWAWQYSLNLIGKDRLPTGEQAYDLAPGQRPPEQIQLHAWQWSYNLNLIGKDQLPTGEQVVDLPPRDPREVRTWSWQYNLNLIGKDRLPVGEAVTALPPQPPVLLTQTWIFSPAIPVSVTAVTFRGLWRSLPDQVAPPLMQSAFPNFLVLQPTVVTFIIRQSDWPIPFAPAQPTQSWTFSYNLNLIGKDQLPTGEQIYDRPQLPIPPAQTWLDLPKYSLIAKPFFQSDWPNPTQPYRLEQTWVRSYTLSLIGQDKLPTGEQVSDLPPRDFARLFQTWISSVNLALTVTPPVLDILKPQRDWPVPRGAEPDWRRSWEFSYNLNLIGQDKLPFRQSDWPLTRAIDRAGEWVQQTNIALLTAVQRPFVQTDWPLPQAPQGAVQTWTNTIGLALTAKPFNQQDWPTPTPPARDPTLSTIAASYNKNLIGQDRLPNRQQDWPLPVAAPPIPLQIMVAGKPFFLVPPQPLPPGTKGIFYDRPQLGQGTSADLAWPAWRWPQITPPPVSAQIPLRTLMGTGV